MKIYADSYYLDFLPLDGFVEIDNLDAIPNGVDIIAITRYTGDLTEHQRIIDQLLPKTKKLVITLIEAVNPDLMDFLSSNTNHKIEFLIDSDLNYPIVNAKTITSWFMCPTNFYVTSPQARSLLDQLTHQVKKPKLFDCLLGTKKPHRDQVEKFYQQSLHQNKFIFTYFKDDVRKGCWQQAIPNDMQWSSDSVDYEGFSCPLSALIPVDIYNQTYYSVVAETTALNTHNQYTEKLAKPILAQRLFVAFAGQHYLHNLRRKGFQTFDGVIDESYDLIEDNDTRFALAWQQIEYLCQQDPDQILSKIKNIVSHNQQHFLATDWHANMMLTLGRHSGARLP
jgi:hypothetical protein